MWDVFVRRWLDLLFWWVPRKGGAPLRTGQPQAGKAPEPDSRAAEPGVRGAPSEGAQPQEPPKGEIPGSAEARARPGPKPAAAQPVKTVAAPVPDDLTEIKGIGPAMQNRLRALGITTFADLAAADPNQLMAQLKGAQPLSLGRVRHWTEAARQRVRT